MNKEYNLKLDLQFRCNNSKMIFDEFDENTSDFFMQISRQGQEVDISNAIPTLLVLKPSGTAVSQILNIKDNLIYGNLENSLKNEVGTYIAKLMLVEGDKKTFISNISYEVTENALLGKIDNDIVEDERYSVLIQLLERLSNIELQEQTRVDNENSRVEAEQSREQIFQNLQDEVKDLLDKGLDLSSLATKEELNELSEELEIHTHNEYALKEEIPTKVSDLKNDSNYLTSIPNEYITEAELNTKGYLTEHQDVSHLATKKELFSKDYNDLTNKPTIPSIDGLATKTYVNEEIKKIDVTSQLGDYAKKSDIPVVPTKISAFSNDKGYLTSVPGEYVTEAELNSKGYLTEHQDISHLATKEYVDNAITNLNIDIDYDSLLAFDTNEIITTTNYVNSDNNIILDDDLPSGIYTLKYEFEDGTYTDIKSFIIGDEIIEDETIEIDVMKESEKYLNQRWNKTSNDLVTQLGRVALIFPINVVNVNAVYTVTIEKSVVNLKTYKDYLSIYFLNESKAGTFDPQEGANPGYYNSFTWSSENNRTCTFSLTVVPNCKYIALNLPLKASAIEATESDLSNLIITLKKEGVN